MRHNAPAFCYHSLLVTQAKFHVDTILLDWDGTLLDSFAADARAYLAMFRALRIAWDNEKLERHYSPDWYQVYRAARLPRSRWAEADRLWRRAYRAERPPLLPGARATLRTLVRRFSLGLVSSGSGWRVRRQVRELGLAHHFAACVCGEDAPRKKPHPAPLYLALERLRAEPEHCVYVGDAPEDVEMARRARVRVVGVLGPFPTAERLRAAEPDLLLGSIRDLPRYLQRHV